MTGWCPPVMSSDSDYAMCGIGNYNVDMIVTVLGRLRNKIGSFVQFYTSAIRTRAR